MKKVFIFSTYDSDLETQGNNLQKELDDGWEIERADRKNEYTIVYILNK